MKTRTFKEAESRYGKIINGKWADESKWLALLDIPERIALGWINTATGKPTFRIYCNRDMWEPLLLALQYIDQRGLLYELKTFDGCYMIRNVRGYLNAPSTHSYALAIDLNAATNALGALPSLSQEFVKCFTDAGFVWGGNFKRCDAMHFQVADW